MQSIMICTLSFLVNIGIQWSMVQVTKCGCVGSCILYLVLPILYFSIYWLGFAFLGFLVLGLLVGYLVVWFHLGRGGTSCQWGGVGLFFGFFACSTSPEVEFVLFGSTLFGSTSGEVELVGFGLGFEFYLLIRKTW